MEIYSRNHVYETLPPFLDNRKLEPEKQFVIGATVCPFPEQDEYHRRCIEIRSDFGKDKAEELIKDETFKLAQVHFKLCRGLTIKGFNDDGRDLTFKEFYEEAPPEIVNWYLRAIMSQTELTLAERKNFLPGSATP